jgi:hypothetical protein
MEKVKLVGAVNNKWQRMFYFKPVEQPVTEREILILAQDLDHQVQVCLALIRGCHSFIEDFS